MKQPLVGEPQNEGEDYEETQAATLLTCTVGQTVSGWADWLVGEFGGEVTPH